MKPTIPLHDKRFRYVNAANTDIRETFARARKEMAAAANPTTNVKKLEKRA
jgi:hypothetical protein